MRLTFVLFFIALSSFSTALSQASESNGRDLSLQTSHVEEQGVVMSSEGKTSWPELVGISGEDAKARLESEAPDKDIFMVPSDSMVTMDYRKDRIRIFVDKNGNVERPPRLG